MSFLIGCHLSSSKGFVAMYEQMKAVGGSTFQYFSRNPRGSAKKALDLKDIEAFNALMRADGLGTIVAHAPYTLNPAAKDERIREFARMVLDEDLKDLMHLEEVLYNFHPGSHVGQGVEQGIQVIADTLNYVLEKDVKHRILLEGMAGKGTEIGSRFEELAMIIERVERKDLIGVCLDSCHLHEAGYDIVHDLDGVLAEFDRIVGLDRLFAIHLNDSKNAREAHKDRHEKIGQGHLGIAAIERMINHPKLKHLPFNLETPNELEGYAQEIALLKTLRK